MKCEKPATEPDTSQSTTSSGRAGRGFFCTTSIGTPPVDMDLRRVRRRSIWPVCARRRRAASRLANIRASGCTTRRMLRSCSPEARRNSTFSASCGTPYAVTRSRPSCSAVRRLVSASTSCLTFEIRSLAIAFATAWSVGETGASSSPPPSRPVSSLASIWSRDSDFMAW
ncbi:Uncharacterised protein [Mycobacteroides abscessus subsp. abscessus]|nr:Uncharacterised protein [Mycobacteroides abscessus subsp. abscessus]